MDYPLVTAHIDLDAIGHNVRNLKLMVKPPCEFMAVVKANGYGHGAVPVARQVLASGAERLGVARLHEAVTLRQAGIDAPILVFGYVHPSQVETLIDLDLTVTVFDFEMADHLSRAAKKCGQPVKAHLKTDTGMGRVGMIIPRDLSDKTALDRAVRAIEKTATLAFLDLEGIYTHFAVADARDKTYTNMQIDLFSSLVDRLETNGIHIKTCHAANSAGIIEFPESHFDMVRAGISIYGLYPSEEVDRKKVRLIPAMTLKSIVTGVRNVPKGFYVSYGMTHETPKATRLASVPMGYADGFSRRFSSNGHMLVNGHRAPIVGRVCMDQTLIDVGNIPHVKPGDEVVVMGSQGNDVIDADELAERIGTINYEIVSALTPRVERIYSGSASGSG
jgi:alanine racemase